MCEGIRDIKRMTNRTQYMETFYDTINGKAMRYILFILFIALVFPSYGADMNMVSVKAQKEYQKALAEAQAKKKEIFNSRASIEKEISETEKVVKQLHTETDKLRRRLTELKTAMARLETRRSSDKTKTANLFNTIRVVEEDLETTLAHSPFSVPFHERLVTVRSIMNKDHYPGIDDLKTISDLFFDEMRLSGKVLLYRGYFISRSGTKQTGDILVPGGFTCSYRTGKETGFLKYSANLGQFFALSALPSWSIRKNINRYMDGKTDEIYMDISNGAAIKQIIHHIGLTEEIMRGGPIVWPILAIGLFALIIIAERLLFLKRVHTKTDQLMGKINALASKGRWDECEDMLRVNKHGPVYNVLRAGIRARREKDRETIESILQEAILRELPRIERFLPTLNIMGSIAPLLGLLGTVTGMINTFHVITLYGTGDPRMMSGGISEALVTTMLGLTVAIPIMVMHTFLNCRVDGIVNDMEEKAVALTNIICRQHVSDHGSRP